MGGFQWLQVVSGWFEVWFQVVPEVWFQVVSKCVSVFVQLFTTAFNNTYYYRVLVALTALNLKYYAIFDF